MRILIIHFVNCLVANKLWNWISNHNGFAFQGVKMDDLWFIDYCIHLKDKLLIELVRSAVCWILWIERNEVIFQSKTPSKFRSLGLKIIALAKFWSTIRNASHLLKFSLVLPQGGREASFVGRNTAFRGGRTARGRGTFQDTQSNVWMRPKFGF
jgi:hypothetical protein